MTERGSTLLRLASFLFLVGAICAFNCKPHQSKTAAPAPPTPNMTLFVEAEVAANENAFSCTNGMTLVPGGTVTVIYRGERWDGECADEVRVEPFCIDTYEASRPDATAGFKGRWSASMQTPAATSRPGVLPWTTSWNEAREACARAGKRLPTLAEWQMAFSGSDGAPWPWGDELIANSCVTGSNSEVSPTGNCCFDICEDWCFRVCDMVGNVSEWVSDQWDPESGGDAEFMVAGGSYNISYFYDFPNGRQSARNIQIPDPRKPGCWKTIGYGLDRSALHVHAPTSSLEDDGFRCAMTVGRDTE
jgi:formylglycine-generating enzyme required for sulfatase activity